jgi:hypothetical protein
MDIKIVTLEPRQIRSSCIVEYREGVYDTEL